jgi:hypothetical protein
VKTGDFFDVGVAQSGLLGEARPVVNRIAFFSKICSASPPALVLRLRRKFIQRADRHGRKKIFDFARPGKRDRNVYQALQGDLPLPFKKLVGGRR